jgi:arabinogalactan oligomer/maltooligosaccharide transport system permease protein
MRRALALVVLALLAALAPGLAACGGGERVLLVWHSYRGDSERALERLGDEWGRANGVRVELLGVPFDAFSAKLEGAVPHDHGPDVFIDAHERLGSYLRSAIVAPAGDAIPDEDLAHFDRSATDAVTLAGARYGVPLETKCVALYLSDALVPGVPASMEDVIAMRATLPTGSYPLVYEAESAYFHAAVLQSFGGTMLDEHEGFGMVGAPAERSLDQVRDWMSAHVVPDEPNGALVLQLFSSGKAAAAIGGPWLAADLVNVKYHVVPLPLLRASGAPLRPMLTVDAAMLTPRGAENADARAFARFLGGTEAAKVRAKVGRQVVANHGAWDDPEVAKDAVLAAFHRAAKDAVPMSSSTRMRATWVPAEEAIKRTLRGASTAPAALEEARRRFDDALAPPPPPPSPAPLSIAFGVLALLGALVLVRRARDPALRRAVRASRPAYAYVTHAAVVVGLLVVVPLAAGAVTSLFAGPRTNPQYAGLGNYVAILTARGGPLLGHGSFWLTLVVTVAWTVVNVALHLGIGLTLGLLLSGPWVRLKAPYRVLLILPWAVPSYVTALAWKGMFHRQFGAVNAVLTFLGAEPVSWFSKFSTAFAANVATNVWLGFPFMMVVTMGALTSISKEVLEAAEVDGATRWQRFWYVTLPLLRPALLPSVILGAVWTFNMFNVVFLVSGGEPDGQTDILISEAYRWAFTRDAQIGYAAAYAVLIFLLLFGSSRLFERIQKKDVAA